MPERDASPDSRKHDPYAAFRIPAYRAYTFGSLLALIGTRVQVVAILWEMHQRTGDALALGYVGLVQAIPMFGLALPAGYLADRFSRKVLIVFCLMGTAATSVGLAALSAMEGSIAAMYALLFLDATFLAIARPARQAVLPQIVPREIFPNAVAWRPSLFHLASVIGPALGGLVILWSLPAAYLVSAASEVIFAFMFARIAFTQSIDRKSTISLRTLLGGIEFVWRKKLVLIAITLDLFAVLLGGAVYLLPIYASEILDVGATGYGWLNAAPGAGALITALLLAHAPPMKRAGRNLLWAVAGFGAATIVFGLSTNFYLSMAMLFLTGVFDNVSVVIRHSLVQLLTPDEMRGRVSAVNGVFIGASNELGGLESGLVAHWFTPVISVVSGGIGTLIVVATTALASPRLRAFGSLEDATNDEGQEKRGSS